MSLIRLPLVCRTAQQARLGAIVDSVDDSPMRDESRPSSRVAIPGGDLRQSAHDARHHLRYSGLRLGAACAKAGRHLRPTERIGRLGESGDDVGGLAGRWAT